MKIRRLLTLLLSIILLLTLGACGRVNVDVNQENLQPSRTRKEKTERSTTVSTTTTTTTTYAETQPVTTTTIFETKPTSSNAIFFTAEERYTANIFLSNFSETLRFENKGFNVNAYDLNQIADFVCVHLRLNEADKVDWGEYFSYSAEHLKERAARFFGITITDEEIRSTIPPLSEAENTSETGPFFQNGRIYFKAGIGQQFQYLSIVTSAERMSNGNYVFYFDVYSGPTNTAGVDDYYWLTGEQAEQASALTKRRSGIAELKPYQHNGKPSYQLVTYSDWAA